MDQNVNLTGWAEKLEADAEEVIQKAEAKRIMDDAAKSVSAYVSQCESLLRENAKFRAKLTELNSDLETQRKIAVDAGDVITLKEAEIERLKFELLKLHSSVVDEAKYRALQDELAEAKKFELFVRKLKLVENVIMEPELACELQSLIDGNSP